MGGTSPNAFANIAQGVLPATQGYQQSIKGIRAEDSARIKELMGLGVSKEKLALEAKKLGISEKRFDQMYQLEQQKLGIMGGQRADAAKAAEDLKRTNNAQGWYKIFKADLSNVGVDDNTLVAKAYQFAGKEPPLGSTENKFPGFSLVTPKK